METEIKTFANKIDCVEDRGIFNRANYYNFRGTSTFVAIKISRSSKPVFGIHRDIFEFANSSEDKFYLGDLDDVNHFSSIDMFMAKINQRGGKGDIIKQLEKL